VTTAVVVIATVASVFVKKVRRVVVVVVVAADLDIGLHEYAETNPIKAGISSAFSRSMVPKEDSPFVILLVIVAAIFKYRLFIECIMCLISNFKLNIGDNGGWREDLFSNL
jgi:hypothetical protein